METELEGGSTRDTCRQFIQPDNKKLLKLVRKKKITHEIPNILQGEKCENVVFELYVCVLMIVSIWGNTFNYWACQFSHQSEIIAGTQEDKHTSTVTSIYLFKQKEEK